MEELEMRPCGHTETRTWGEVVPGDIVIDKKGHLHTVSEDDHLGSVVLEAARNGGVAVMRRPDDDRPVDVYLPSHEEALVLLHEELGARYLQDIEDRERTLTRAAHFRVDPIPRKATKLRDHIDWLHGVNVDDVLRRHNGTDVNPSTPAAKRASVEELCQAHDEMHSRPDLWPHSLPHHHKRIGD